MAGSRQFQQVGIIGRQTIGLGNLSGQCLQRCYLAVQRHQPAMGMSARVVRAVVQRQQPLRVLPAHSLFQQGLQHGVADLLAGLCGQGQCVFPARGIGWQLMKGGEDLLLEPESQLACGGTFALS